MRKLSIALLAIGVALVSWDSTLAQVPQTTSFQGILLGEGGTPAVDGTYELVLSIYDAASGGEALWTETQQVETRDGVFSATLGLVTPLDLDFDVPYWIGTSVGGGTEIPTRIALGSAPYSLRSASVAAVAVDTDGGTNGQVLTIGDGGAQWMDAPSGGGAGDITAVTAGEGLSGGATSGEATLELDTGFTDDRYVQEGQANAVTSAMIANGSVTAEDMSSSGGSNGQVLTVTGSGADWQDAPDGGGGSWGLTGNSGTTSANFIGTTDDKPFEIKIDNLRVMRFEKPSGLSPNVIMGNPNNSIVNASYSTITGGGLDGSPNQISGNFSFVGSGIGNEVNANSAAIAGGSSNTLTDQAGYSFIGSGLRNEITSNYAVVAGGIDNVAGGPWSAVGGGTDNQASGNGSMVPGGYNNIAAGVASFAAGYRARAAHTGTFVWADVGEFEQDYFTSTGSDQFLVYARNGIGLNTNAPLAAAHVKRGNLNMSSSGLLNDDLVVEDGDAVLGLYSSNVGSFGSAIVMAEYSGGSLDNKWGIARNTTSGGNLLRFTFGTNADYSANNTVVRISTSGNVYADGGFFPDGADVAESVGVAGPLSSFGPGDVLAVSSEADRTFDLSSVPYMTTVAGVYATKPGVLLSENGSEGLMATEIPMAVIGIVPTKVTGENGPIRRGDLLVTSSTPGHAMKADPDKVRVGMVLGKALGNFDAVGTGVIAVLVSLK